VQPYPPSAMPALRTGTVRLETEVEDPEQLAEDLHAGKLTAKP